MIDHLSYSSVSTMLKCPRQWKYRYVDRLPSSMSGQLIAGNVYHKGLAWLYSRAIAECATTKEERLDVVSSFWEEEISRGRISDETSSVEVESVFWGKRNTPKLLKQKVMTMVDVYANKWMPKYRPVAVEKKLTLELPSGILLIGYSDVLAVRIFDSVNIIIDHKWRGKPAPAISLENDFQSTTYTILTGIEDTEFHEAISGSSLLAMNPRPVHRSKEDCEWVVQLYEEVWQQIQRGVFPPNPLGFLCNPVHCTYYSRCRLGW